MAADCFTATDDAVEALATAVSMDLIILRFDVNYGYIVCGRWHGLWPGSRAIRHRPDLALIKLLAMSAAFWQRNGETGEIELLCQSKPGTPVAAELALYCTASNHTTITLVLTRFRPHLAYAGCE